VRTAVYLRVARERLRRSYWAFTFVTSPLSICFLNFLRRGEGGVYKWFAAGTFALDNIAIGAIFVGTIVLMVSGKLFSVVHVLQEAK